MKFLFLFVIPVLFMAGDCNEPQQTATAVYSPLMPLTVLPDSIGKKMCGLTFVAPPEPFPENPMPAIKAVGASWISIIPYGYTRIGVPKVRFEESNWQWWGEQPAGVRESIRLAHAAGIKVMLKPQIYIPGGWTGAMDYTADWEWVLWEADYKKYIMRFARLADSTQAEMFCIGTEFKTSIAKRPQFWSELIREIKSVYKGKLTYSSNWDDWNEVPFWADMDYIGLGGYFPLVDAKEPAVEQLKQALEPIRDRLKQYAAAQGKPILFTEFGYLSVDGCGWRNWELEKGIEQRPINEQAQANCYEAFFATFYPEPWWAGCFLWKWFPNMRGHEGYPERDYTPQGKIGEGVVRKWYGN